MISEAAVLLPLFAEALLPEAAVMPIIEDVSAAVVLRLEVLLDGVECEEGLRQVEEEEEVLP